MENININAWVEVKDENSIIIDVRTLEEYNEGHIEGAINIDIFSPHFEKEVMALNKDMKYYVVCRSGGRSSSAASALDSLGFSKVTNMMGGMMSWLGEIV